MIDNRWINEREGADVVLAALASNALWKLSEGVELEGATLYLAEALDEFYELCPHLNKPSILQEAVR